MAGYFVFVVLIAAVAVSGSSASLEGRRLQSYYPSTPSSGSSPIFSTPSSGTPYYSVPSSNSSPTSSIPSSSAPYPTSPSSGSSPSTTPVTSSPSPVTSSPAPVVSTPSGKGTCNYWKNNPGRVPKVLSLISSLARAFGPRALKAFGNHLTLLGAVKSTETDPMSSLAREGSASLLNAYAYHGSAAAASADADGNPLAFINSDSTSFPLSASDVVSLFNAAVGSPESAAAQAARFQHLNEAV